MKRTGFLKPGPFKVDQKNPRRIADEEYQISSSLDVNKVVEA
ncbi:hypothetical protein [Bacillus cereus]